MRSFYFYINGWIYYQKSSCQLGIGSKKKLGKLKQWEMWHNLCLLSNWVNFLSVLSLNVVHHLLGLFLHTATLVLLSEKNDKSMRQKKIAIHRDENDWLISFYIFFFIFICPLFPLNAYMLTWPMKKQTNKHTK